MAHAASFNLGLRLVRGAVAGENGMVQSGQADKRTEGDGRILIAYFFMGRQYEGCCRGNTGTDGC